MKQMHKLILAGSLVAGCVAVGFSAVQGAMVTSVPFSDVEKRSGTISVYGVLDKSSIRTLRGYNLVSFTLVDEKTGKRMPVMYDNAATSLPANFPTASHAKVTGTFDPMQKQFLTDSVMTKCPSKYKEEDIDAQTKAAVQKWQKAGAAEATPATETTGKSALLSSPALSGNTGGK